MPSLLPGRVFQPAIPTVKAGLSLLGLGLIGCVAWLMTWGQVWLTLIAHQETNLVLWVVGLLFGIGTALVASELVAEGIRTMRRSSETEHES